MTMCVIAHSEKEPILAMRLYFVVLVSATAAVSAQTTPAIRKHPPTRTRVHIRHASGTKKKENPQGPTDTAPSLPTNPTPNINTVVTNPL